MLFHASGKNSRGCIGVQLENQRVCWTNLKISSTNQDALQIIVRVKWTPEDYLVAQRHYSISPPLRCPNCSAESSLVALGYYERWLSGAGRGDLRLPVRRFRCRACGRTVSLLPDFAQPYRLVRNEAIERYFSGETEPVEARRHVLLLRSYWRRFTTWLPDLRGALDADLGRSPPASEPRKWWVFLMGATGSLARATLRLVEHMRITVFGRYRCHQARPL